MICFHWLGTNTDGIPETHIESFKFIYKAQINHRTWFIIQIRIPISTILHSHNRGKTSADISIKIFRNTFDYTSCYTRDNTICIYRHHHLKISTPFVKITTHQTHTCEIF